jgi:hypothetical protein
VRTRVSGRPKGDETFLADRDTAVYLRLACNLVPIEHEIQVLVIEMVVRDPTHCNFFSAEVGRPENAGGGCFNFLFLGMGKNYRDLRIAQDARAELTRRLGTSTR